MDLSPWPDGLQSAHIPLYRSLGVSNSSYDAVPNKGEFNLAVAVKVD